MKKFLLLLAGLAISASAFAQDAAADETTYGFKFKSVYNRAVYKGGYTIKNTEGKTIWFQMFNGNIKATGEEKGQPDTPVQLINLDGETGNDSKGISAIYVKWHGAVGTVQLQPTFKKTDNTEVSAYLTLGTDPGEKIWEISDIRKGAETRADIKSLSSMSLAMNDGTEVVLDECYIILKDGSKMPLRLPRNNNTYALTNDFVPVPCSYSHYYKDLALDIYAKTGDAEDAKLAVTNDKKYKITVEIDPGMTVGQYQFTAGANGAAISDEVFDNTKSTWELDVPAGKAYSTVSIKLIDEVPDPHSPLWITIKNITVSAVTIGDNQTFAHSNTALPIPTDGQLHGIIVSRTFSNTGWEVVCFPFPFDQERAETLYGEGTKIATFDSYDPATKTINFNTIPGKIEAGTPFIMLANISQYSTPRFNESEFVQTAKSVESNGATFVGFFNAGIDLPENACQLSTAEQPALQKHSFAGKNYGFGMRSYFTLPTDVQPADVTINFNDGPTTGIGAIAAPAAVEDGIIYDLQGRALGTDINALGHGLYIRNGKKFVK